jgi:acetolactate synthase small subunit
MVKKDGDHSYTLLLTVRNRPGVLVRCAQVFGRRSHNIEALQVAALPGGEEDFATMTIAAFGKPDVMHQIVAQLSKLVDVINVIEKEK